METSRFDYDLPEAAIAQEPVEPRHTARLLDTRNLEDHRFSDLPSLLRPGDLVVVNRTRVRPARLHGSKLGTGGKVEALVLRRIDTERWELMVRPARRLRQGSLIRFGEIEAELLTDPDNGVALATMKGPADVETLFEAAGEVPLPPYITSELADPERYQTIFADKVGSAAAPTAGLHFSPEVVSALAERNIDLTAVELEVGLATFRPITTEEIEDHRMHTESYRVPEEAVEAVSRCRGRGGRVVAIGTTVLRTLESVATARGGIAAGQGETDLYVTPGFEFKVVDLLVTNFHLPRSSLTVLVAAFIGERWLEAYEVALERGYRFLSFGDAMLCERQEAQ